jgi:hypothetical protein
MKVFIFSAIAFLSMSVASAQDSAKIPFRNTYKHGIGFAAGFTTGYGLSYRYMPARFGAQITFAPYHDDETDRFSTGLTLLYTLVEGRNTNLFLYQGTHYYYHSYLQFPTVYDPNFPDRRERVTDNYVNLGVGVGIEITMAKRVGLNLMTGYAAYDNFNKLNITGEVGLFYKF